MSYQSNREQTQLLTIAEACRCLAVSRSHFYELVAAELITIRKVGGASRVLASELNAYITGLTPVKVARRERRS